MAEASHTYALYEQAVDRWTLVRKKSPFVMQITLELSRTRWRIRQQCLGSRQLIYNILIIIETR